MTRRFIRTLLALAVVSVIAFAPAGVSYAQEQGGATSTTSGFEDGREPAVVLSDGSAVIDDPAWTFRYLVPTLLVITGAAVLGVLVWYGFGVKGRYRVAR
ncbi:MAG: hypothetical protein MUP76_08130 [Acidimicrobiia bacterium]|nr:hypothetical protein [Acidimicrobiia bacterium]